MSKRTTISDIATGITELYVQERTDGGNGWTASLETIRTGALLDIVKSLRRLVQLVECPNVYAGFRAMQELAKIEKERERRRRQRLKRKRELV